MNVELTAHVLNFGVSNIWSNYADAAKTAKLMDIFLGNYEYSR